MFAFTRNERIALTVLVFFLIVGGVLSWLDKRRPEMMEEFRVVPGSLPAALQDEDSPPGSVPADTTGVDAPQAPATVRLEPDSLPSRVNINTASARQLEALPGIGPVLARRIIEHRNRWGPFRSVRHLAEIEGIGDKTLAALDSLVTVRQDTPTAPQR